MQYGLSLFTTMKNIALTFAVAALLAGCGGGGSSSVAAPVMNKPNTTPGQVLSTAILRGAPGFVNAAGFTVYVFDADLASPGHSVCNGACAQNWPPLGATTSTLPAPFSAIVRADGSMQLAYAGRPLYLFIADRHPGDTFGDGINAFGGLWHIARPQGAAPGPSPSPMASGGPGPY